MTDDNDLTRDTSDPESAGDSPEAGESLADRQAAAAAANAEAISQYDDSRRPLAAAAKTGALALVVAIVLSLLAWGGKSGMPGVWGVLVGGAIGGGFVLVTVLLVWATAKTTPAVTGAVVMGGWLLKIIVLIAILATIDGMSFYDRSALFVTVLLAMAVTLGAEMWGMSRENLTYYGSR